MSVILFADSSRCPELRHEVPHATSDPFLYVEHDGRRIVVVGSLESELIRALGGLDVHTPQEFGADDPEVLALPFGQRSVVVAERACRALGVREASVPGTFPLALADRLREAGITLRVDDQLFDGRRRRKSEAELAGIRRAQIAAEAGMHAAAGLLRRAQAVNGTVLLDGPGRSPASTSSRRSPRPSPPTTPQPTTSSSRPARRRRSGTTWAPGRSAPATRS